MPPPETFLFNIGYLDCPVSKPRRNPEMKLSAQTSKSILSRLVYSVSATLVIIALLFVAVPRTSTAGPGLLYVHGYVTDVNGSPIQGASVTVTDITSGKVLADLDGTDADGLYFVTFPVNDWAINDNLQVDVTCSLGPKTVTGTALTGDVTISVQYPLAIPEFGSLVGIIAVASLLAVVALVSVGRKRS